METLTDLITLLFQALLGIGAIVSLGWFAASGKHGRAGTVRLISIALAFSDQVADPSFDPARRAYVR
jgi:hypothetical protein